MEESQLLKGVLEGCVLGVITGGEIYGYEIRIRLEEAGFEAVGEGTLYPILSRLEKKGMISCRKEKSPYGPMRKYYSMTDAGWTYYHQFRQSYCALTAKAMRILGASEESGEEK
jgi:PadR family transcriptional regulator PadR